jgi:hypothetical protein
MQIRFFNILLILLIMVINSCVEEYWPDLDKYENILVVDGTISNDEGPYTVNISVSTTIENPKQIPYPGCEVIISDNTGYSEELSEIGTGTYLTAMDGIRGKAGNKYKLTIRTPEGRTYETDYTLLTEPVGIDSVYGNVEIHNENDPTDDGLGVQFYIDTKPADSDSAFFLWKLTETYQYESDFTIDYLWKGYFERFHDPDTLLTCWITEKINNIYTYNTLGQSQSQITGLPLNYVSNETKRLTIRYSLLVEQYTMNYESQKFWQQLQEQSADQGTLYSKQPYQIKGNIRNVDNEDEPVLGYFNVAGKVEKRIFIDKPFYEFDHPVCFPDTDVRGIVYWPSRFWPIYVYLTTDDQFAHGPDNCFDCTLHGGNLTMPPFWTND